MIFTDLFENTDQPSRVKFQGTDHDIGEERYVFSINGNPEVFTFSSDEDNPDPDSPSFEEILAKVQRDGAMEHRRVTPAEQLAIAKKIAAERQRYLDQRRPGVSEGIDIGQEWMTDTELDQYVPDDLQQEWRELVGYDEAGNAHPLWANMTGDYEPDVSDPEHRAWMVKVANKWFAMKRIPNVRFFAVRDRDDELEWLVQIGDQGVAEAMKPSDIPPAMRKRLTMRDIEAERPRGAFRFRVITPQGDRIDFMDRSAADSRAKATGGRVEPINPQPQGLPGRNRFRVQDPEGTRPAATFQDRAAAERYASAKKLPVEIIPETESRKGASARIERILKMLRARHPQAENDLEALIFDFRGQQAQDRTDIARLDAENDMEEADIARLEKMLDLIRRRRGAAAAEPMQEDDIDDAMRDYLARGGEIKQEPARMPRLGTRLRQHGSRHIGQGREGRAGQLSGRGANTNPGSNKPVVTAESLRDGEHHIATVTLDDGSKKKVRITSDEGFRDQIERHFAKQGHTVTDIDVDYAVRSDLDEAKKKPQPTNPELWGRAKAAARSKFDVYPSAYANAWAAKWYKSKGGGWRMGKPKKK